MKTIAVAILAATIVLVAPALTFADDDKKSISGYGCFPQSGRQTADFYYEAGALVNRSVQTRFVVCSIFRDLFSDPNQGDEVDRIFVYFNRSASTESFACQALVRNAVTGAIVDSDVKSSSAVGTGTLTFSSLNYVGDDDVIYLFCQVSPQSRLLSMRWEEDVTTTNGTDTGEGE